MRFLLSENITYILEMSQNYECFNVLILEVTEKVADKYR